jgi:hypothetical protein
MMPSFDLSMFARGSIDSREDGKTHCQPIRVPQSDIFVQRMKENSGNAVFKSSSTALRLSAMTLQWGDGLPAAL